MAAECGQALWHVRQRGACLRRRLRAASGTHHNYHIACSLDSQGCSCGQQSLTCDELSVRYYQVSPRSGNYTYTMAVMPSHESVNTSGACAAAGQWFAVEPAHAAVVMDRGGGERPALHRRFMRDKVQASQKSNNRHKFRSWSPTWRIQLIKQMLLTQVSDIYVEVCRPPQTPPMVLL